MDRRTLGTQGLRTSAVGLGCMGMSQGYGPRDDAESTATIRRALDLGVDLVDTAITYGRGANERLVGAALAGRRDEAVLATKFGIVRTPGGPAGVDGSPANARTSCERSLRSLGVDHVDLYYLHRVDPQVPVEESIGAMADLVAEGKVRHLGMSEATASDLERASAVHPIAALQSEWSLWCRDVEDEIVPTARRLGIGLVAYSPLGRGFLAGAPTGDLAPDDWRRNDPRFRGEALAANLRVLEAVRGIAAEVGATPAQLAIAWLLDRGDDVVALPGISRRASLDEDVAATDVVLTAEHRERIESAAGRDAWSGESSSFARAGRS